MKTDASAIANYFIQKGKDRQDMTMLKILKLVYIAHGFSLALLDRSLLNPHYDEVQAWKFGPVIPSLYHTLKVNGRNNINTLISIPKFDEYGNYTGEKTPEIPNNTDLKNLLNKIWNLYGNKSASQLVDLLHQQGTPWHYCFYNKGERSVILDTFTKLYYTKIVEMIVKG